MFLRCIFGLTVYFLMISSTFAVTEDWESLISRVTNECSSVVTNQEVTECLNEFGEELLAPGGLVSQKFYSDLDQYTSILERKNIPVSIISIEPMNKIFNIRIPTYDPLAIKPVQCFDFNRKTIDVGVKLNQKQARVNQVVRVMIEAAVFLKQYHVYSMGQISSLLFQPLDVEVCSLNILGRKIELQESVLKIGYKYTMVGSLNADYSAKNITQDWNDGLIVKPNDRPGSAMLSAIKRKFTGEINPDIIEDAEYAKWVVLNPQGKVRRTIRNVILPTIKERIRGLVAYGRRKARADHLDSNSVKSSDEIRAQLQLLTQHKGFSVEMRNYIEREAAEEDLNIIYQDFISKINSSLFLGQSILYASSSARMGQCESMNATVQANRKQSAFINMINAKNIGVNLSTLGIRTDQMDKFLVDENESDDSEGGQCTQSVSVNDVQEGGLVSINLIDNVMVFVKLPSRPGERLSYLALYEVLEKHMNNQGYLNYSR